MTLWSGCVPKPNEWWECCNNIHLPLIAAADTIEARDEEIERLRAELELHRAGTQEVIREEIRLATQRVVAAHREARRER